MRENKQKNAFSLFSHLQKSETDMAAAPQEVIYHFTILRFYHFTINHFIGFLSTSEWLYLSTSKPEKKVTLWWIQYQLDHWRRQFSSSFKYFLSQISQSRSDSWYSMIFPWSLKTSSCWKYLLSQIPTVESLLDAAKALFRLEERCCFVGLCMISIAITPSMERYYFVGLFNDFDWNNSRETFNEEADVAGCAPGRVNLIGEILLSWFQIKISLPKSNSSPQRL